MSDSKQKLLGAFELAMKIRPKVGGFPVLAEVLRQAGVRKNYWSLPSCQSVYVIGGEIIVQQGEPLVKGLHNVSKFDQAALIKVIRADQNGETTFPEFLEGTYLAGVTGYDVDFEARTVKYYSATGEFYLEEYPLAKI